MFNKITLWQAQIGHEMINAINNKDVSMLKNLIEEYEVFIGMIKPAGVPMVMPN